MTWVDFETAGFAILRSGERDGRFGPVTFSLPYPRLVGPDDPKLLSELRFEIDTRLELVGDGDDFATWRSPAAPGTCAHCGDERANFGTCGLCELARAKMLRAKNERQAA